jgi:diacylglycerol O-acyltransferase
MSTAERAAEGPAPPPYRRLLRRRDGRAPLWIELAVIGWLFWLYDVINDFAPERRALALRNGAGLLSFEHGLGIGLERTLDSWLSVHSVLAFIATYYYFFAHALVTFAVLALLWWRSPARYRRMRAQLVLINLIAFVVFWRYPLAPPRMFPGRGFVDVVASTHAVISWHSAALSHDADQFAAMPSLHLAWASWSALGIWQLARRPAVRALGPVHVAITTLVVLATGNHYLVDVVAGLATTALGVALYALGARAIAAQRNGRLWPRAPRAKLGEARAPANTSVDTGQA